MDHHEAAAADIAGARIGDGEREADGDRGIDRVAAAVEDLDADARGAAFLRHHHAVAAATMLRAGGMVGRVDSSCWRDCASATRGEGAAMKKKSRIIVVYRSSP